jgi:pSer/pThr/pTyr-binding forkhead associated (FHA) protein
VLVIQGQRHELSARTTVLGRSREADIRIEDANISRRHAEIRHEDGAHWVVDLGSTNGIEVNGRRVDRARLSDGDRIVLGRTEVVFGSPG